MQEFSSKKHIKRVLNVGETLCLYLNAQLKIPRLCRISSARCERLTKHERKIFHLSCTHEIEHQQKHTTTPVGLLTKTNLTYCFFACAR